MLHRLLDTILRVLDIIFLKVWSTLFHVSYNLMVVSYFSTIFSKLFVEFIQVIRYMFIYVSCNACHLSFFFHPSISRGKMGASLHRSSKAQAIGGKPPYLKVKFNFWQTLWVCVCICSICSLKVELLKKAYLDFIFFNIQTKCIIAQCSNNIKWILHICFSWTVIYTLKL